MRIDLHTHTYPASDCSQITYRDYIAWCVENDVRAVALTNHGDVSDNRQLEAPLADHDVLLVHGVEISTLFGDFVVLSPDLEYLSTLSDVQDVPDRDAVPDHAAVVWVHPIAGGGRSGSVYYPGLERMVAPLIDAVEVYNGTWSADRYVAPARTIAEHLGLAQTGGSDAHRVGQLGVCVTELPDPVRSTADVVAALRAGAASPHRSEPPRRRRFSLFSRDR